ncbi:MAG: sigma-54 dependent transcriptional regulator [Proteobacteria bacterium]|jgi:DNA-binding NtrC family response regulator|nr:sigma-54 dependent transcriptional regulator [Pseudomonadota bacterium]
MSTELKVAIIDDEVDIRDSISQWLSLTGYKTESFPDAESALLAVGSGYPGVVISDIRLPGLDGIKLLKHLMYLDPDLPVIMITGHGDVPMAVEAMHIGAFDFLEKPFEPEKISLLVAKAIRARELSLESRVLREEFSKSSNNLTKLIGHSPIWTKFREDILNIGLASGHVLIRGESGSGKTLIAHALNAINPVSGNKFLSFSCLDFDHHGLMDDSTVPSLVANKITQIETLGNGAVILEDIQSLSEKFQLWLVNFLNQQGPTAKTRIISIDNSITESSSAQKSLRKDLYYRLSGMTFLLPALRERQEDIVPLFNHYLEHFLSKHETRDIKLSFEDELNLIQYPWPGNVRQLKSVVEQVVLQGREVPVVLASILLSDIDGVYSLETAEGRPLKQYVESFERSLIDNAMRRHNGSISAVMNELQLPRRTLNEKMTKYNLYRSYYV